MDIQYVKLLWRLYIYITQVNIISLGVSFIAYWKLALVTVVMVLTCMTVGIVFNDLSTVVGITGAIGGSSLMAIIPSLLFILPLPLMAYPN